LNIDELCGFLQSIKGKGFIDEKIQDTANIISVAIHIGSIEINYEYKYDGENYSFVTARFPCEKANNTYFLRIEAIKKKYAHIQDGRTKKEEIELPKKDVKKLFKKKKVQNNEK